MRAGPVLLAGLLVLAAGVAGAADQPVFGTKLRDTVGVAFVAKDPAIVPPAPGSPDAPDQVDWMYEIYEVDAPPSENWSSYFLGGWTSNAAGTRWKFLEPFASHYVRVAIIKPGALKVKVTVGDVPWFGGNPIAVVLRGGSLRYCAVFEPDIWVITQGAHGYRFVARNAPAPTTCPEPSASPSGAFLDGDVAR